MISVICVFNNREILESCLLKSLSKEENTFDLVLVDNTEKAFSSAASALNHGAQKAKGNFLAFVHQDVVFGEKFSLSELENQMDALPVGSIAGAAGRLNEDGVITSMTHGEPPSPAGTIRPKSPTECQTVDEVMIGVRREMFEEIMFDPLVCNGWHLYGVDFCLSAGERDYKSFVLPMDLHHRSPGYSMDDSFYEILKKVVSKHKNNYKTIYSTNGIWPTSVFKLKWMHNTEMFRNNVREIAMKTQFGRKILAIRRRRFQKMRSEFGDEN